MNKCVFLFVLKGEEICILGHDWRCETDATLCGDVCPDYRGENDATK